MIGPYLSRYRNAEFVQYISQVVTTINKQDVDTLLLTEPLTELSELLTTLENAYRHTLGSPITPEIVALDKKRDNALRGFKMTINAYTASDDATEVTIANRLLDIITKHGKEIYRRGYNEQTRILATIIKDIESNPEFSNDLVALNADIWFLRLKQANINFNTTYLLRVEETVDKPSINFAELRKTAGNSFKTLIDRISAHAILTNNELYGILIHKIEVLSDSYNRVVNNRSKAVSSKDSDGQTDDTAQPNDDSTTTDNNSQSNTTALTDSDTQRDNQTEQQRDVA